MLIRTPEDIFRAEKKDLYVVYATKEKGGNAGLEMIRRWVQHRLPGTKMEKMAPSEHSGFLSGGPVGLRIDFTEEGLREFSAEWEDESGASKDSRFQCYLYPYETWYQGHGRYVPTLDKPSRPGKAVWWYTPEGFVYHQLARDEEQLPDEDRQGSHYHPASPSDIWMHAVELWPEKFGGLDKDTLTYGRIFWSDHDHNWCVLKVEPFPWGTRKERHIPVPQQIRDWFNLPADVSVEDDGF